MEAAPRPIGLQCPRCRNKRYNRESELNGHLRWCGGYEEAANKVHKAIANPQPPKGWSPVPLKQRPPQEASGGLGRPLERPVLEGRPREAGLGRPQSSHSAGNRPQEASASDVSLEEMVEDLQRAVVTQQESTRVIGETLENYLSGGRNLGQVEPSESEGMPSWVRSLMFIGGGIATGGAVYAVAKPKDQKPGLYLLGGGVAGLALDFIVNAIESPGPSTMGSKGKKGAAASQTFEKMGAKVVNGVSNAIVALGTKQIVGGLGLS